MTRSELAGVFDIEDHAYFYGLLAKAADALCGEEGDKASAYFTKLYAEERGRRMRNRALADHMPLTLETYRLYTEWADLGHRMKVETLELGPNYRMNGTYCVWNEIWKQNHMEKYGRIYCAYVDQTMVHSFNPNNELIIHSTLSAGGAGCDFEWVGLGYESMKDLKESGAKKQYLRERTVKDFLYHCGHLYSAAKRGYGKTLGEQTTSMLLDLAMQKYRERYGSDKANAIIEESGLDFDEI